MALEAQLVTSLSPAAKRRLTTQRGRRWAAARCCGCLEPTTSGSCGNASRSGCSQPSQCWASRGSSPSGATSPCSASTSCWSGCGSMRARTWCCRVTWRTAASSSRTASATSCSLRRPRPRRATSSPRSASSRLCRSDPSWERQRCSMSRRGVDGMRRCVRRLVGSACTTRPKRPSRCSSFRRGPSSRSASTPSTRSARRPNTTARAPRSRTNEPRRTSSGWCSAPPTLSTAGSCRWSRTASCAVSCATSVSPLTPSSSSATARPTASTSFSRGSAPSRARTRDSRCRKSGRAVTRATKW